MLGVREILRETTFDTTEVSTIRVGSDISQEPGCNVPSHAVKCALLSVRVACREQ